MNKKRTIICFILSFVSLFISCGKIQGKQITKIDTAMGTIISQNIYSTGTQVENEKYLKEIMDILDNLEINELSWRQQTSMVNKINESAGNIEGIEISKQFEEYLNLIEEVSISSHGALDITLGKIVRLWNIDALVLVDSNEIVLPKEEVIEAMLSETGYEKIKLENHRLYLPENMSIDLGSVGKGIGCDVIGAYLKNNENIVGGVISVGGSVVTYGEKTDNSPWVVGIMNPRIEGTYLGIVSLQGEWYISTSGDYERYVEVNGVRYHHILDPSTGNPVDNELCSVTIISKNGLLSDGLSTACFVLGVKEGLELAESFDVEILMVDKNGTIYMSEGMKSLFEEY